MRSWAMWAGLCGLFISTTGWAKSYDLDYTVRFAPKEEVAYVTIRLEKGENVRKLDFSLGEDGRYSDFKADGRWEQESPERGVWKPANEESVLSYKVKINNVRGENGRFDARMTDDWALLRGDDLIPAARLDQVDGTVLKARLQFELPEGWKGVETGWPRIGTNRFRIDNPARLFDRPTGWIVAGKIGSRRTTLGETTITVAAPIGEGMRRMDITTLLTFVWPHLQEVFPRPVKKILIVGAGDPMWRGGLSAPNSLYLHTDRPLVSENGTSTLIHEMTHVVSRIRATDKSDWITEGIAEFYAIELLRRAGGISDERYEQIYKKLSKWGEEVKSLRTNRSSGPVTARAVILLKALDQEIRSNTQGAKSLDDVAQALMRIDKVTTDDFTDLTENVLGAKSRTLNTRLLR